MENRNSEGFLRTLMTGLIYPAILGNIIYMMFTVCHDWTSKYSKDDFIFYKVLMLLLTAGFFLCDYIFIYLTVGFKKFMFWFALFFLLLLLGAFSSIGLDEHTMSADNFRVRWLLFLGLYLIFMVMYWRWDYLEKAEHPETYAYILKWEKYSVIALIVNLIITIFLHDLLPVSGDIIAYCIGFITISGIIFHFIKVDLKKFNLWKG